jgi:hypothetical protein
LARPFGPQAYQIAAATYLYGSTAKGILRVHHGVDIPNPQGTEVLAVAPASVLFAGSDVEVAIGATLDFYGQLIILLLDQTYRDQPLGGNSYESTRSPGLWLEPWPGRGTIAGRLLDAEGRTLPEASVLIYRAGDAEHPWRVVPVYADDPGLHPDDEWGENFLLADVPAGHYRLAARVDGRIVGREVVVEAGKTTFVDLSSGGEGGR